MARIIHSAQCLVDQIVSVPHLPVRGLNTIASGTQVAAGGAVNVLLAARRSGANAVHAGTVGRGPNGTLIRTALESEGVTISSPELAELDTGICFVLLEPSGERTFVTQQGAEREITVGSLQSSNPTAGDYVCVSGYTLQGKTRDPLLAWLQALPATVRVVLDPGAAFAELDQPTKDAMLARTDVWTSNAQEAQELTGAVDLLESTPLVAKCLRTDSVSIVRDGPNGCAVHVNGTTTLIPGYPQTPVDTNGAGDAHTGALVAELSTHGNVYLACQRANVAGAIKVTRFGPATAPTRAEIDEFLARL